MTQIRAENAEDRMGDRDPRTHAIIGAAIEVHRQLGCGFLEAAYQQAFAIEMAARDIPFAKEVEMPVLYKGQSLQATYRADFFCFDSVVVEVKALPKLTGIEEAQLINYLKVSGHEIGLLLNFGARSLKMKRMICSKPAAPMDKTGGA
jgi:GxxExxY protein